MKIFSLYNATLHSSALEMPITKYKAAAVRSPRAELKETCRLTILCGQVTSEPGVNVLQVYTIA
jgi:hypothetical protein